MPAHSHHGHDDCTQAGCTHGGSEAAPAAPGAQWTCPMHPEIVRGGPGSCPVCGMALEPMTVSADTGPNPELADMTRRLWIGALFAVPLFAISMGEMIPGLQGVLAGASDPWVQLALATPVVFWAGWPLLARGWQSVVTRNLNMFTLIALGTGAAYLFSLAAVIAPGIFPDGFRQNGRVAVYFEAAAVITVLVLLGQVLELRARERTSGALRALLDLAPRLARRVVPDGDDEEIPLDQVRADDLLRVRPGEKVPADGAVEEGAGTADESMLTGEAMPVAKTPGDRLIGGTLNIAGGFVMRVEKTGGDTMLSHIVQMVARAQRSRAPVQRIADRVAAWFVPAVILVALIAFIAWSLFGPQPAFAHAIVAAVSVFIIACPCALGLATPMSIMVGTGRGAEAGVLIRDAEALEVLESVDVLIVDKTGTLTEGKPRLSAVHAAGNRKDDTLLALAASLERGSEHPLAAAIAAAARERGLKLSEASAFESVTGKGVTGTVSGKKAALGNAALMADLGIGTQALDKAADGLRGKGATVMYVAAGGKLAGLIAVADPVKDTTREALEGLREAGVRVIMATGDNERTARAVARDLGLDEVEAGVLPEDKAALVRRLAQEGHIVAVAGDGVNDAPALAEARVGIAMGQGTDIAMESAGITLVKGDLRAILRARRLSAATMRNIRENLFFAFAYNALGVPVAAGLLYPVSGLLLSPMIAAVAMSFSSVSVIANALRLRAVRI